MKKILLGLFFAMFAMQVNAATFNMYSGWDGTDLSGLSGLEDFGDTVFDSYDPTVSGVGSFTRYVTVNPDSATLSIGGATPAPEKVNLLSFSVESVFGSDNGAADSIASANLGDNSLSLSFFMLTNSIYELVVNYDALAVKGASVNINVEAVPLPAAVWLFGSALMGLFGVSRRKSTAVAA